MPFYIFEAHKKHYEKFADGSTQEIDVPYDIPNTWEWVRVGNICTTNIGLTFKPSEVQETGIPIYKANNIKNGKISTLDLAFVSEKTIIKENEWLNKNDILMAVRSGSKQLVGKTAIVGNLKTKTSFGAFMSVIRPISVSSTFMNYFFQSSHFRSQLDDANTTTIFQVTQKMLKGTLLPLPPLAEQKRIVAQIERALKKVEIYAESYNRLEQLDKEFPDKLKKSILQYAMQGKLVEQDPNDESVEVLLEKIRAEKQKLFEEGKIKKKDLDISIVSQGDDNSYYEEVPYKIPENWEWVKLGSIGIWNSGATPPKANCSYYSSATIPWLLTGDLTDSYITNIPNKISELALKETSVKVNPTGSILIAMYGATVGKLGILTFPATTNQACCACSKLFQIEKLYLFYFLMAERNNFKFRAEGGAQPNISKNKIINTFIPLPPLSEQTRIVDKIEESFAIIDALI